MRTIAIGFFDGVHLGHRLILGSARRAAAASGSAPTVVTFDRHPLDLVDPGRAPRLLMAQERRLAAVAAAASGTVHVLAFDEGLRDLSPPAFVERVVVGDLGAERVVVGENFRFGHRAAGDVAALGALCAGHGVAVEVAPLVQLGGAVVSSSAVREAIARGALDRAAAMLGRPHQLDVQLGPARRHPDGSIHLGAAVGARSALPPPGAFRVGVGRPGERWAPGWCRTAHPGGGWEAGRDQLVPLLLRLDGGRPPRAGPAELRFEPVGGEGAPEGAAPWWAGAVEPTGSRKGEPWAIANSRV